jgi:hypothetical protein
MRSPLLILLIVPLASCTMGTKKQAVTPPPPKPAAVQAPAPEAPLSIPQTSVVLPPKQEFNPDAIPKVPVAQETPAPEKTEVAPAARVSRRAPVAAPKAEPEPETETPPAPAVQEQAAIQPILSGDQQKKIKAAIADRRREISDKIDRPNKHLSVHDNSLVERIKSFLEQCGQAELRGDYSQADALSERAAVLARELQGE